MTTRTSGTATGLARRRSGETNAFMADPFSSCVTSQIAGFAQALEGVLRFVIHCATGSFGNPGRLELGDDLVDRGGVRSDGKRDVHVAERAVALSVAREIKRDDWNAFAPRI